MEEDINQFAISKVLGSKIVDVGPIGFGGFHLFETARAVDAARQRGIHDVEDERPSESSYEQDSAIVAAFEAVRNGAATDELLWNRALADAFIAECRRVGADGPQGYLVKRLVNVRKNAPRYRRHGIQIAPAAAKVIHESIVPRYAHVIEFSLVKLRYRFGASIDDILMDPQLGDEFERLAHSIAPHLSSQDLRLGALYIRKNRVLKKRELEQISALDLHVVDEAWRGRATLARTKVDDLPRDEGLIELTERDRFLYVSRNDNIHDAVEQLQSGSAFRLVGNSFWHPDLERINLFYVPGSTVGGTRIDRWEQKLIHDREPVLNWPMPRKAA